MATKNLARTVIEGGRAGWSQYEARHQTRRERRGAKSLLHGDRDFDDVVFPKRRAFELSQNDKVNPALRWLLIDRHGILRRNKKYRLRW